MFSSLSWRTFVIGLLALGVFLSAAVVGFYILATPAIRKNALLEQDRTAYSIMRDLETAILLSEQVGRSSQAVISPIRNDVAQVETHLQELLGSASPETVYGIGAWFEPNVFTPTSQLFGPYVHRVSSDDPRPVLTYEWTTAEYNFYTQPWYLAGRNSNGTMVFTEPYFDTDLVYMSGVQPFTDQGRFAGVITVDLVLPQLREIINSFNQNPDHVVYVLTNGKAVFAHPDEQLLLDYKRSQGQTAQNILDITESDLNMFAANGPPTRRHRSTSHVISSRTMPSTGWQIVVSTDKSVLYSGQNQLLMIIVFSLFSLWTSVGGILWLAKRSRQSTRLAQKVIATSEHKFSQLFDSAPYPIMIFDMKQHNFTLANRAALDFYHYTEAEIKAKNMRDIIQSANSTDLEKYDRNGSFEDYHRRQGGEIVPVVVRAQQVEIDGHLFGQYYITDQSIQKQTEAQVQQQGATIQAQNVVLAQASTPFIPITDTIVTIPLIGSLSQERAAQFIDILAHKLEQHRTEIVILDVTGVAYIDDHIAKMLVKAHDLAHLFGAQLALVGIRPELAQLLVNLNVPLDTIPTYSTLQQAIHTYLS